MKRSLCLFALLLTPTFSPISGHAQNSSQTLRGVLSDTSIRQTMKLGDLAAGQGNWFEFEMPGQGGDAAGYLAFIAQLTGGGSSYGYFTTGQQVTIGDTEYLVAYTVATPAVNYKALMSSGGFPKDMSPILSPDTPLKLSLLNLRTLSGLTSVRAFDLQALIADSRKQHDQLADASGEGQATAVATNAESNAKQLGFGVAQYVQDHNEKYPPMTSASAFKTAVYPYIKSDDVFKDARTGAAFLPNAWLSRKPLASLDSPSAMIAIYSPNSPSDNTRIVGFADSHVKKIGEAEFESLAKKSHIVLDAAH